MARKVIEIIVVYGIFLEMVHRVINKKWLEGRPLKKELEKRNWKEHPKSKKEHQLSMVLWKEMEEFSRRRQD